MTDWNDLVRQAGAPGGSGSLGKYEVQLSPSDRQLLQEFVVWMERTNRVPSANSRSSYKSGVAKAKVTGKVEGSNQKSYLRLFGEFLKTRTK